MPPARQETRYDVFISYRRGAADELALLLQRELERHKLSAFLDRDLRRGTFDDKLLGHIADSPTFLIILTPNALDRCSDEDDWLRKEIVHAINSGRNIVPLKIDPFQFTPEVIRGLDSSIRELSRYQAVEYSRAYFEHTIERIVRIVEGDKAERRNAEAHEANQLEKIDVPEVQKAHGGRSSGLRKMLFAAGSAAVAVLVVLGVYSLFRNSKPIPHQPANQKTVVPPPAPTLEGSKKTLNTKTEPAKPDKNPRVFAPGTVRPNPRDGQKYVWIPPGTFQMGCSVDDSECYDDEKPAHKVNITRGFWIGQTEVSQAAYQRVMRANPSHFQGEQLPVESVSWSQAKAYCDKAGMRLPTEAEWEYAARAGSTRRRNGELDSIAWYGANSGGQIHEVGLKKANAWNLYDMLGNVWEWVGDRYDPNYYRKSASDDPKGPASGQSGVLRGGGVEPPASPPAPVCPRRGRS